MSGNPGYAGDEITRIIDPLYIIDFDSETGIVRVGRFAVQTEDHVGRYIAALKTMLNHAYRRIGAARVLVDLSGAPVRTQGAVQRLREYNVSLYRDGDRVAIVVDSALLKMQLRRTIVTGLHELFDDNVSAKQWLLAA